MRIEEKKSIFSHLMKAKGLFKSFPYSSTFFLKTLLSRLASNLKGLYLFQDPMSLKEGKHSLKVINSTQIDALMILLNIKNELQNMKLCTLIILTMIV